MTPINLVQKLADIEAVKSDLKNVSGTFVKIESDVKQMLIHSRSQTQQYQEDNLTEKTNLLGVKIGLDKATDDIKKLQGSEQNGVHQNTTLSILI